MWTFSGDVEVDWEEDVEEVDWTEKGKKGKLTDVQLDHFKDLWPLTATGIRFASLDSMSNCSKRFAPCPSSSFLSISN